MPPDPTFRAQTHPRKLDSDANMQLSTKEVAVGTRAYYATISFTDSATGWAHIHTGRPLHIHVCVICGLVQYAQISIQTAF